MNRSTVLAPKPDRIRIAVHNLLRFREQYRASPSQLNVERCELWLQRLAEEGYSLAADGRLVPLNGDDKNAA